MEGYAEGFRSVLKPVLSPYMQNIRPLKIAYTVNVPVFLNAKKCCDDVNYKFWGVHLRICILAILHVFSIYLYCDIIRFLSG